MLPSVMQQVAPTTVDFWTFISTQVPTVGLAVIFTVVIFWALNKGVIRTRQEVEAINAAIVAANETKLSYKEYVDKLVPTVQDLTVILKNVAVDSHEIKSSIIRLTTMIDQMSDRRTFESIDRSPERRQG